MTKNKSTLKTSDKEAAKRLPFFMPANLSIVINSPQLRRLFH